MAVSSRAPAPTATSTGSPQSVTAPLFVSDYTGVSTTLERPIVAPDGQRITSWDTIKFKNKPTGSIILSLEARHGDRREQIAQVSSKELKAGLKAEAASYGGGLSFEGNLKAQADRFFESKNEHYALYLIATIAPRTHTFKANEPANLDAEVCVHLEPIPTPVIAPVKTAPAKAVAPEDKEEEIKATAKSTADIILIGVQGNAEIESKGLALIEAHLTKFKLAHSLAEQKQILKETIEGLKAKTACLIGVKGNLHVKEGATAKATASLTAFETPEDIKEAAVLLATKTRESDMESMGKLKELGMPVEVITAEVRTMMARYNASLEQAEKQYAEFKRVWLADVAVASRTSAAGMFSGSVKETVAAISSPAPAKKL